MDTTILLKIMFCTIGGIIAGAFFITALYYQIRQKKENKCTCKTFGKIISNIRREEYDSLPSNSEFKSYRRHIRWYSLCEYTVGDTKCVKQTNIGTPQPREVGKIVTVYYNPNNCHESYIEGDNNSGFKAIVSLILGIISVAFIYLIIKSIS